MKLGAPIADLVRPVPAAQVEGREFAVRDDGSGSPQSFRCSSPGSRVANSGGRGIPNGWRRRWKLRLELRRTSELAAFSEGRVPVEAVAAPAEAVAQGTPRRRRWKHSTKQETNLTPLARKLQLCGRPAQMQEEGGYEVPSVEKTSSERLWQVKAKLR